MIARSLSLEEINIGDEASFKRVISEADVANFAQVSGDFNPLHTDETYAAKTELAGMVVHGMLLGALVSRLIGMDLPGERALLVKETLEFKAPVRIGDELTVSGLVTNKSTSVAILEIAITINSQSGVVVTGQVFVKVLN